MPGTHLSLKSISQSLISRLIILVGLVMFVVISTWAYFNINYYKNETLDSIIREVDRLGSTIKLGTHYAMMLNSREDINIIINNIGRQKGIESIRIFNKNGEIKFSKLTEEVGRETSIKDEECAICHRTDPPLTEVELKGRTKIFDSGAGHRMIGVISPIYNEAACSSDACHVHPGGKKVLGALDVAVSLEETDAEMMAYETRIIILAILSFLATSTIIATFLFVFVNLPIKKLIGRTIEIGRGQFDAIEAPNWRGEIGQLSIAIDQMGSQIRENQTELQKQRHEYRELFEQVPCYITVQDKDLRLIRFNREFKKQFEPAQGEYCYQVYKGREEACDSCPVRTTFEDGLPHMVEETGITRDGSLTHWLGSTSPIRDSLGQVVAVMEMSLDITQMKRLEEEIRKSEEKYRSIFNNIPNPIFVLDSETLMILDCNDSVTHVYGFPKEQINRTSFVDLFDETERDRFLREIRTSDIMSQAKQYTGDGRAIFVNIRISPSEYLGRAALLVSTSDVTKRLLAEQQLIQASKMATLGEMATGMAHELNQPLSVMKTASNFLLRKVQADEVIRKDILETMSEEIDKHVDRASKIINHLREFGRKSEVKKEKVDVNAALQNALDIFSQQLRVRGIELVRDLESGLPVVLANANRLEQVFINLLINARDAIEDKVTKVGDQVAAKEIRVQSCQVGGYIVVSVSDTGTGIALSNMDRIFEPFFTTKKVGKGTGLGLSISYGIVMDYDGSIRVVTEEGMGSTFVVELPVAGDLQC